MVPDTSTRSPEGLLTLLGVPGVGPRAAERLAGTFPSLRAVSEGAAADDRLPAALREKLRGANWSRAHAQACGTLERAQHVGVEVLSVWDPAYPLLLNEIADRPLLLYVRGRLKGGRRSVACVGTREPTDFGRVAAERLTRVLGEAGWSIVSGLAIGVDSIAHKAALDARAHTVAVLANGLDKVYPKSNEKLAADILAGGGALVSEQPFGMPAVPRNLVQRDRLQSGMSVATVVLQTDVVGGSMHTVRFTLLQNRLLVAPVPTASHASEAKSRGLVALTQRSGPELADLLKARAEYGDLLRRDFRSRPVAYAVSGRADYDRLLQVLEDRARSTGAARSASAPQMGLFT